MTTRRSGVAAIVVAAAVVASAATAGAAFTAGASTTAAISAATLAPATGLALTWQCPPGNERTAQLAWTASASPFATGYVVERLDPTSGAVLTTTAVSSTSFADPTVAKNADVRYRVTAAASNWRSAPVEVTGTAPAGGGKKSGC